MTTLTTPTTTWQRTRPYGTVVSNLLLAAFTLSVVYTVYAWATGLPDPDFTVTTPLAWAFYAVGFAVAGLARRDRRWASWALAAYLVGLLAIALFYYPTTFTAAQQTVVGWFENDVYTGLLMAALGLQILRMRRVNLVAGG